MDAGKLFKMDQRVEIALDIDDSNSILLDKIITACRDVTLEKPDSQAFIKIFGFKGFWGKPEL